MGNYTIFLMFENPTREAGKQEILQQMFRKFYISNRLPNRYFPKIDVGCPWNKSVYPGSNLKKGLSLYKEKVTNRGSVPSVSRNCH